MKVSLLSYKHPEIKGPKTGVFAKIPHHSDDYDRRYFQTTYRQYHNENVYKNYTPQQSNHNSHYYGIDSNHKPYDKIRITTDLVAEQYKNKTDPKENTSVQRTWQYKLDSAIESVKEREEKSNFNRVSLFKTHNKSLYNIITNECIDQSRSISNRKVNVDVPNYLRDDLKYKVSDVNVRINKPYNLRGD